MDKVIIINPRFVDKIDSHVHDGTRRKMASIYHDTSIILPLGIIIYDDVINSQVGRDYARLLIPPRDVISCHTAGP